MSNIKNYSTQGGKRWVVKGELELAEDGRLLFNGTELKPAAAQENSSAESVEDLKDDFNDMLARLKAAGLMKPD